MLERVLDHRARAAAILVSTSATRGAVFMRVERARPVASMLELRRRGRASSLAPRPDSAVDPGPCFNGGAAPPRAVARTGEIARATVVERG